MMGNVRIKGLHITSDKKSTLCHLDVLKDLNYRFGVPKIGRKVQYQGLLEKVYINAGFLSNPANASYNGSPWGTNSALMDLGHQKKVGMTRCSTDINFSSDLEMIS